MALSEPALFRYIAPDAGGTLSVTGHLQQSSQGNCYTTVQGRLSGEVILMDVSAPAAERDRGRVDPEIVALLPEQGMWSERDYLWLTGHTNRLVEYSDGSVEVLPMPTEMHQAISRYLFLAFLALMQRLHGEVFYAPLRLRVRPHKFRDPDLLLLRSASDPRRGNDYWLGADLVVEIVSPDDPDHDYVTKRAYYAAVEIPEYWIVDPQRETITVLRLTGDGYAEHGVFGRGSDATSAAFPDFAVPVDGVFDAANISR
jgi:Uma2 family endonuclease